MRLLNVHTLKLHTFYGDAIPKYAILSHTWLAADEEVTFLHLQTQEPATWRQLPGAKKIFYTCQQARGDGHTWAWIDTCSIDKSNNAELSEAINSMFRWYQRSEVCYVYLSDHVYRPNSDPFTSRWWTRAWTLQELVAPKHVQFFDAYWQEIGTKSDRADDIASRIGIDARTLHDSRQMYLQCVAQRMSWASNRQATREEDLAYSLLGIFNINMTMQYGEGEKAFIRLQQEITRTTSDMSIFAWGFDPRPLEDVCIDQSDTVARQSSLSLINANRDPGQISKYGLYADSPIRFQYTQIEHLRYESGDLGCEERQGVQNLRTITVSFIGWNQSFDRVWEFWSLALLPCVLSGFPYCLVGLLLRRWDQGASRNMRHAFRGEVFSCLIRSEHISGSVRQSVKVDSVENQLYRHQFRRGVLERTLLVRTENMEYYPYELLEPTELMQDPNNRNCFIMPYNLLYTNIVLRFLHQDASVSVFVGCRQQALDRKKHDCVIRAEPSSTSDIFMREKIRKVLKYPSIDQAYGVCRRSSCKHDRLRVTAETTFVFNQALTILTLAKSNEGSYDRDMQAICVPPKDRLGSFRV
jgi:hypothetical protein